MPGGVKKVRSNEFVIEIPKQILAEYMDINSINLNISSKIVKKRNLPFKNPSNSRHKEKSRISKNIKNMMQDTLDSLSFNEYQSIEAGPSVLPKKKYCDITGLEGKYTDPKTGLRYYNSEIFKIVQNLSEPIKNQYLSIRKALFIIK